MTERAPAPAVAVVIPTRDRPEMVRAAIASAVGQDYPGQVDVLVVHDGSEPDPGLVQDRPGRTVRVLRNTRAPGLPGTRNTGILACGHDLVAFLDDDDTWLPGKLAAQVALLEDHPRAELCSSGVVVDFEGRRSVRLAGSAQVTHRQLLRSRMSMLHSSTFLFRRCALLDGIGLVDEQLPDGQNEDWDLLLRTARRGPVLVVEAPLAAIRWGRTSFYARRWDTKISSLEWMLAHHPELVAERTGSARVYGQLAFAHACSGRRRTALSWAGRALRRSPTQWRGAAAALVACRVVDGERLLERLHRHGRGV